jgi:hypothetical protein
VMFDEENEHTGFRFPETMRHLVVGKQSGDGDLQGKRRWSTDRRPRGPRGTGSIYNGKFLTAGHANVIKSSWSAE